MSIFFLVLETNKKCQSLKNLLSSISALSETKRKVETIQEQKTERIASTETKRLERQKEAYEDYEDEDEDEDED